VQTTGYSTHCVYRGNWYVNGHPWHGAMANFVATTVGVAFSSGAAAAFNCLIEHKIDAVMARTRARPLPTGQVSHKETMVFATLLGGVGLAILYVFVNPLTMWLTFGTFVGYAVIYTVFLKPATPMNIVIGGASGAMPPILGWAAVNNVVSPESLIMFLIIFAWTPPHFWALALYRREEYAKVGMPMLPVTHGEAFTLLHILLYTIILVVVSLMPYGLGHEWTDLFAFGNCLKRHIYGVCDWTISKLF
jgi:heme o synthase